MNLTVAGYPREEAGLAQPIYGCPKMLTRPLLTGDGPQRRPPWRLEVQPCDTNEYPSVGRHPGEAATLAPTVRSPTPNSVLKDKNV